VYHIGLFLRCIQAWYPLNVIPSVTDHFPFSVYPGEFGCFTHAKTNFLTLFHCI